MPCAKTLRQSEANRRSSALASSVSAPVKPWSASPFESMSFNGRRGALGMAWPADGPREAHAFERLQSFNAQEAMLAASASVDSEKLALAPGPEPGKTGSSNASLNGGRGCSLRSVAQQAAPHLRCAAILCRPRFGTAILPFAEVLLILSQCRRYQKQAVHPCSDF